MAGSISNARFLSSVFNGLNIRGFATASVSRIMRESGVVMMKKGSDESKKSIPWVPDPVTGYYRPEGQTNVADAAELRELLLRHKNRRN